MQTAQPSNTMELKIISHKENGLPVNNHEKQIPRLSFVNDAQEILSRNDDIG